MQACQKIQEWFKEHAEQFLFMTWPPNSHDLNPIIPTFVVQLGKADSCFITTILQLCEPDVLMMTLRVSDMTEDLLPPYKPMPYFVTAV